MDYPRRHDQTLRPDDLSMHGATRGDRPKTLHPPIADTNVPVVAIDCRVAVPGHQPELLSQLRRRGFRTNLQLPVLVGSAHIADIRPLPDRRHAAINRHCLMPDIDDGNALAGYTH